MPPRNRQTPKKRQKKYQPPQNNKALIILTEAIRQHKEGNLLAAEKTYREVLAQDPKEPNAHHLLGLIAHQTGHSKEAVQLIRRAIELYEPNPEFHYNLGTVLHNLGDKQAAIKAYRRAIALRPIYPDALSNLAGALTDIGEHEEAIEKARKALEQAPKMASAYNNLGLALKNMDKLDEAIEAYRQAIDLNPTYPQALNNMGQALKQQGHTQDAITQYEKALSLVPNHPDALNNLGNALLEENKCDEAIARFEKTIQTNPRLAEASSNLGNALKKKGDLEGAMACYQQAIEKNPAFADGYYNIACLHHEARRTQEAFPFYEKALSLNPSFPDANWNLALLQLLTGDYEKGWPGYEWRWQKKGANKQGAEAIPLWDGTPLNGKRILLQAEQGLGDSLQFIRYAKLVKERGGQTVFYGPAPLLSLFESVEGLDERHADCEPLPSCDVRAPLMSLPHLCGTTSLEKIPSKMPYFQASAEKRALWSSRFPKDGLPRIGLLWAGNPRKDIPNAHEVDKRRSMRLEQFAPLATIPNVCFYSLQKGELGDQAKTPPAGMKIVDYMNDVQNFEDTAALIENLDLVIGVDTSVVHLAGGLNKPVWILSRFDGCWRWLLERSDSPWYPSARLFRQKEPGDWAPTVEAVRQALETYLKENSSIR